MGENFIMTRFAVCGAIFLMCMAFLADAPPGFAEREPYVAPPYVPPPPPVSDLVLIDNGDGTVSTPDYRLMWARKDSYADLGKCMNWYEAAEYVDNLETGGYRDWRLPRLEELGVIYDNTKENVMAWDHNPEYPLALDEKFAAGAAYWYWSADYDKTDLTDCCARSLYFVTGLVHLRRFSLCADGGVRAVRDIR